LSNKNHKNIVKNKFAILVNIETYIALWLLLLLNKKIKIDPRSGKNIIVDKIGKFILI
tara:strand:+ start:312 stop:485 length:174 start_codon:yes stop_codon:yes gene_type:complete